MADLLRWSVGMALPKKKDGNNNSVISSLKMMGPTLIKTNTNNNQVNTVNNTANNTSTVNNPFSHIQQINEIRQQAEQRRQQEEQQRQQQIERTRQEQEERQRKENERRLQQQQAFQQKQNNLLNSSLRGGNLLSTLSSQNNLERRMNPVKTESDISYDKWLGTTSMDNLSKEMEKAKADNNTDWIRRIQQYSGKNSNDFETYRKQSGLENSELNLGRSAATSLRDINDTRTYDTIDVNDSDNVRYFGRQNLLKKAFKAALGDNAEVGNMSYRDVVNSYNNASGDQQADIKKAIADEIVTQKEYAKKGNQESLKSISYLSDLNALLNEYGTDKGKSFGKQLGDWLSTGGFVGNIGGNALTEALGNITGNEDATKAYLEKQQNTRADLGAVGAIDTALTGIANTAMNLGTGGWYGIANAGVGTANAINGLDDKVLDFDDNGNASIRDKETGEKLSELGSAGINAAFALAGKAGIGPALGSGSAKDILKYAWQEPLWAGGTTLAQEGFSNLGKGKEFGDYDWGKVGQSFIGNLGQDIGMDLFNLGRGKAQAKIALQQTDNSLKKLPQNSNVGQLEDGTMVKINSDGSTSKLTDAELAKLIANGDQKPYKIEYPVLNGETDAETLAFAKQITKDMAQEGRLLNAGDIPELAKISSTSSKKQGGPAGWDSQQIKQRAEILADIDSVSKHLQNVRFEEAKAGSKDGVIGTIKGDVGVDISGKKIYPEVVYKVYSNGDVVFHDITKINRLSNEGSSNYNPSRHTEQSKVNGQPSDYDSIISQKAQKVQNGINKLADLSYDVSTEVGNKAKKAIKKAADIANEHPLGGTTKLMDLSGLEDANKIAINGKKMTTEQFFDANKIGSNDLTALKQNYPKEVKSVRKLIKAGVTPETFNNKVLNSDGTAKTAYKYQDIPAMRAMFEMSYNYNKATDVGVTKDQTKANLFSEDAIKENTTNKSSFARKTGYNQNFSEETRNALANDPVEYKPTTNEERLARANEILSSKSLDQVDAYLRDNYFNTTESHRNSGDTVLAGEFAKMLDADGQYGRATEIVQKMSEIATKQGQQIQALSIISNRTPEGIANMAQNAIQKGGGKVDGELRKQILSNTQEIGKVRAKMAELSAENDDISYKIMNGEGDLPTLRKKQMAIAQEYRTCLDQEGRDFAKLSETVNDNSPRDKSVFGSVWRAGLLSGPRTHVGNAVSNTFQNALNAGAERIASGLDWARSKITGGEREVVASDKGLRTRGKGLKRGLSAAGEVMRTGTNLWEGTEKVTSNQPNAWGYGGELSFKNKIADTMVAKPTNFIFRAMSAGDLPFRYSAFENAIRTEAKRQGMNQGYKGQALRDYINSRVATPDPDLRNYGIQKGNESVYDADTFLSRTMSALDKQINKIDNKVGRNAAKTAKTLIAPFVKVPSKVLSTAIDYSPVGAVQAVVKKVGGSKNYTTAQFETDLAKSGLGTGAFVGLGYALSSAGLLTGGYPDDKDERNRWKAEGIEPNSIKIGDKYVSLNYLGPAAILMGMGAGVQKRQEQGQDPFTVAIGSIGDTFNAFFEQSYVQGLNSAIDAVKDSQRYGESYANSLARGLVPNLLRQTAVATDSKQRQVNNPLEAITSGIPGLSQSLDAKVDAYGREIENKQTLPLGQMWDALKISNSRETNDVIDEVSRLHSVDPSNKELQVTPPMEDNNLSVNGTNVKITDSQKAQLQKDVGEAAVVAMRQVMQSSSYASLSDAEKAAALDKARSNAQTQARKQFIEANGITAENNSGNTNSGGAVEGDYANKAISSVKSSGTNKNGISVNDSLSQEYKDILSKYNSMSSDDWNNYLYGSTADSAAAEYKLARAKYENDLANGDITDTQKIKKQKELAKLAVSQQWTKDYRDVYSLAGSKSDMQAFLNELDGETRAKTVATLNGLNNAMYEAGVITESTYKTRANAINNTTSKKSSSKKSSRKSKSGGMSSAEASALSSLAKTMAKGSEGNKVKTTSAPNTKRKMSKIKSSGGQSKLANYSTNLATNVTVNKGAKRSIG